ncbi:MAG: nucleotidyltransferase domain-containing protein [Natronospirillum sp.]
MRLNTEQVAKIQTAIFSVLVDEDFSVALFGSRLNDDAKGGDVDLVITTPVSLPLRTKAKVQLALESALQLPVDLVFYSPSSPSTPFQRLALRNAHSLSRVSK